MGFTQLEKDGPWEHTSSLIFEEAKILHIPIKKKWFDMIKSGEKKEEYREITKHWCSRLVNGMGYRKYDIVRFRNGYGKNVPQMDVECLGIHGGGGKPEWGAEEGKAYFVIHLGKVI